MSLSPIEQMIDAACGLKPGEVPESKKQELSDEQVTAWLAVVAAAETWWQSKRPTRWRVAQHLKNPTINTTSEAEKILARAVAAMVKIEREAKK